VEQKQTKGGQFESMQFFIVLAGLVAGVISGTIFEDYLTSTMPSLTADTICPGIRNV
jgi:hypothetical protein